MTDTILLVAMFVLFLGLVLVASFGVREIERRTSEKLMNREGFVAFAICDGSYTSLGPWLYVTVWQNGIDIKGINSVWIPFDSVDNITILPMPPLGTGIGIATNSDEGTKYGFRCRPTSGMHHKLEDAYNAFKAGQLSSSS